MPHGFFTVEQWDGSDGQRGVRMGSNSTSGFLSVHNESDGGSRLGRRTKLRGELERALLSRGKAHDRLRRRWITRRPAGELSTSASNDHGLSPATEALSQVHPATSSVDLV